MRWSVGAWRKAERSYFSAFRLSRAGEPRKAVEAFDRVIDIFPKHVRAHAQRGLALAAAGRVGEGVRSARRAIQLDPKNHAPHLLLGQIQYDAGNLEEARKAFSAAERLDPENRLVKAYLGLTLLAMGRTSQGAELLQEHLPYGYEALEARLLTLAEQYLWQHREQARPLEDQLSPDEGGRQERPAGLGLRVISAVRKVLLLPLAFLRGRAFRWRLLAAEAMSVRDYQAALSALRKAEEAGADPTEVALDLGQCYLELRQPQAACEQFARLPEELLQNPEVAFLVGLASFESGHYEQAREPLEKAAARFTREFVPSYYRGLCDIALGEPKAACKWFHQAAERLNPQLAQKRLEEMLRVRSEVSPPHQ
jgi:tetratricopeptide (TPR) repeat protein